LNCPTSNSRELLACLRNMEAAKILEFKRKLVIPIVRRNSMKILFPTV
jgi:hypothetical protein